MSRPQRPYAYLKRIITTFFMGGFCHLKVSATKIKIKIGLRDDVSPRVFRIRVGHIDGRVGKRGTATYAGNLFFYMHFA